jgi:hypothetical protein
LQELPKTRKHSLTTPPAPAPPHIIISRPLTIDLDRSLSVNNPNLGKLPQTEKNTTLI